MRREAKSNLLTAVAKESFNGGVYMDYVIRHIKESEELIHHAAEILTKTFTGMNKNAWPDVESAKKEVQECIQEPNLCIGVCVNDQLCGWVGLRPMYEKTWELHPLVVDAQFQKRGIGRILIAEIEQLAREAGVIGIVLGTDDETGSTSLSHVDMTESNLWHKITHIKNINNHPYEFYQKCGYCITGIIPNANGRNKPDIWMWKNLNEPRQ